LAAANARRGYALQKVTKKIKVLKKPRESVTLPEALRILRAWDVGNPQHQVEVHIKCAVEKSSPVVRGSIVLPKSIKQEATILVFAEGKAAEDAKQAGAHIVGGTELIPRVEAGEFKFDKCLCTPALLPAVAKIARYLGPKNLMPSVKRGK
jgi:large subunit ribosomal protein L1